MIVGVNHVQITIPVGSEKEAKYFYCKVLGLKEIAKPDVLKSNGGFWLQAGGIQIHVGIENGVDRNKTKAHIAYEVQNIGVWRSKIKSENIEIYANKPIPGYMRFEFRDPFGNRVEIIEKQS